VWRTARIAPPSISWASLTSLSRVGPGPKNFAANTMKGFANTKPVVRRKAPREITAFRKRGRVTEYWNLAKTPARPTTGVAAVLPSTG
jgi:hypothetical protein